MTFTIPVIILPPKEMVHLSSKSNRISLRLSQEESNLLSIVCSRTNMTPSQYIRSLITNAPMPADDHKAEIMKIMCQIYVHANEKEYVDEEIREEYRQLCQKFLS